MTNNIKAAREKSRLTQRECADYLGITLRAWQTYEQGSREPKFELLVKIADLFHVTTDYLLGRDTGESTALESLAAEFDMSALEKDIIEGYLNLPDNLRGDFMEFLQKAVQKQM